MKPTYYVKSLPEYDSPSLFDEKKILAAARRLKKKRKFPTSVALEEETIQQLKTLASWRGVPYQILMRMFILDGLRHATAAQSHVADKPHAPGYRARSKGRRSK